MGAPIALRGDYDVARLRSIARGWKEARQTRRLLVPAAIYHGARRTEAVRIGGVTHQVIRNSVLRAVRTVWMD